MRIFCLPNFYGSHYDVIERWENSHAVGKFYRRNMYLPVLQFIYCCLAVRVSRLRTGTHRNLLSAIWVLVAQWLERLTGDQKVAGSIRVWGSETFFWVCDKAWVANSFPLSKHLVQLYLYLALFCNIQVQYTFWPLYSYVFTMGYKILVAEACEP